MEQREFQCGYMCFVLNNFTIILPARVFPVCFNLSEESEVYEIRNHRYVWRVVIILVKNSSSASVGIHVLARCS